MTEQEIFNQVFRHLMTQMAVSTDSDGTCAYRGTDGRMCAIGCLIKDEHYDSSLEGLPYDDPEIQRALWASGVIPEDTDIDLLRELQWCHDNYGTGIWFDDLVRIAKAFDLKIPRLEEDV